MTRKTFTAAAAAAVTATVIAATLTACTGAETPAPATPTVTVTTTAPAAEPTPAETTPAAPTFEAGDTITDEEAAELPETQRAYTASNGKKIVVDLEKKGLPKAVTKDIAKRAKAVHDNENTVLSGERTSAEAGNISREIGKNVAIIYRGMGNIGFHDTGAPRTTWYAAGTTDRLKATYSKDEQVAVVKKWIKKQDEEWILVVRAD